MSKKNDISLLEKMKAYGRAFIETCLELGRADYVVEYYNGYQAYVTEPEYQLILAEPDLRRNIRKVDKLNK